MCRFLCSPFSPQDTKLCKKCIAELRLQPIARVNPSPFRAIHDLIKGDEVFNGLCSCNQFPVQIRLVIALYRLGASGEGGTITLRLFGNITNRVFQAILKLKNQFLYWPNDAERKSLISETFLELPHCVGYVDGTEIRKAEKPFPDTEAYFSKEVQAVCGHKVRVRHMVLEYPGIVHDARIYNNCSLTNNTGSVLSGAEWSAGDNAFKLTSTLITAYRTNSTEGNAQQRKSFNRILCKYRKRIEYCFGLMKRNFNSLKELKFSNKNRLSVKLACFAKKKILHLKLKTSLTTTQK